MTRPLETSAVAAFSDELAHSLPRVLAAIDAAKRERSDLSALHEAYRLIHALKGAASMVGLAALGYLLNLAEERLEAPVMASAPVSDEVLTVIRSSIPQFADYMDAALAGRPVDALAHDLAQMLDPTALAGETGDATLRELLEIDARELKSWQPLESDPSQAPSAPVEATPAPPPIDASAQPMPAAAPLAPASPAAVEFDLEPAAEISPELAEVFGQEAQEHLQTIARLTSAMSASLEDRDSLQELRRAVHTLKGAAGVVGYKAASRLAHRMEDLLDRLYEGAAVLTPQTVHALASASDALDDLITGPPDPAALRATVGRLFDEFDTLLEAAGPMPVPAEVVAAAAEAASRPAAPVETASEEPAPLAIAVASRGAIVDRRRGGDRRHGEDRRGSGQVLRVPFQRLNELVRVVSELVINRSTFEQHYAALLEQVDELKLSTARLRRVAQKLEADYEVRALAGNLTSSDATGAGGHGFDELEFDRYTEFHLLSRELTETASDIATISTRVGDTVGDFDGDLTRLGRLTRDAQDKTMEFRMVPLGTLTARLDRAVRVTAEACGKRVDFAIEGDHVALDKSLLEEMADPLLHLLRNAVDHGIEPPERRRAAGKPEHGRIVVRAFHEGTDVLIEVQDDGAGLDMDRIRRRAIERGLVGEADAAALTPDALYAFIFEPGFSTASQVSEVSGRGVGMDIVKSKVARVNGRIQITSQPGSGAMISVRVPMTLAITRILLIRAGGETFGLPLGAVVQIVRPHPAAIGKVAAERVLTVDGRTYPLRDLADTLGLPHSVETPAVPPVLIANLAGRHVAFTVDEILHSRDAVVKTLGTHLRRVHGVWGATLLGDGTVILILNPVDLGGAAVEQPCVRHLAPRAVAAEREAYTVLVVDDSLSMRHVLSTTVRKAGWNPVQARDGLEALEIIHRSPHPPDLVLLDIEMPRMDGFEFLATVRGQKAHSALPIVMLTSRGGDKHREKAHALGATDYMVKPFQEEALIHNIDRLVRASRGGERRAAS